MNHSCEPKELELPLEFKFAMRKVEVRTAEMTWEQLHQTLLHLYKQRLIEITAIKDIMEEEGVNIEFDIPTELELAELGFMCSDDDEDDEEIDKDNLQPF
jgi:hypothetical protein